MNTDAEDLLKFLIKEDERTGRDLMSRASNAGIGPMKFGPNDQPTESRAGILIEVAIKSLERACAAFAEVRTAVEGRLGRASKLRLGSAVITTILSSGVVASLSLDKTSHWGIALGVLALVASLLTIVAGRLEGGEANIAQQFGEVAASQAEALALLDRLRGYMKAPELFGDIDKLVAQAGTLVKFLEQRRAMWLVAS
jgi:hypothetical protein